MNTFSLSTVERNSIGGWTVRYPLHDESDGKMWFGEAHFDQDRKGDALLLAHEKESAYLLRDEIDAEAIEQTFNTILQLMHNPERYVLLAAQIKRLADQIANYKSDTDSVWYIGENDEFTVGVFITAAYWHFSHWHDGQGSWEYQTLSSLGRIFSPGMTSEPEPDDPEHYPFQVLGETAASYWGHIH